MNRYPLKLGVNDRWRWRAAKNGIYSTKAAYDELSKVESREDQAVKEEFNIIWNKLIPSKVRVHT
ncbi:hypothetical protein OROHE_000748 [Orobanche hederae]